MFVFILLNLSYFLYYVKRYERSGMALYKINIISIIKQTIIVKNTMCELHGNAEI